MDLPVPFCPFILSYWKGITLAYLIMLFISKWIKLYVYLFLLERKFTSLLISCYLFQNGSFCPFLSLYSFLLERNYTSLFNYVIYFKMDQTVCLFIPIGKEVHKPINFMLFISKWIFLSLSVPSFFPIGKEIHKHIYLYYLFQNGSNCLFIFFLLERKYTSIFIYII